MDSKHKNNCAICYEKIYKSNFTLDCGHKFHISCLNQWRKIHKDIMKFVCPYCRSDIDWTKLRKNRNDITRIIKIKLEQCAIEFDHDKRLKICIEIFAILNQNVNIYINHSVFMGVMKKKIIELCQKLNDNLFLELNNISYLKKKKFIETVTKTNKVYKLNIKNCFE